MVSENNIRDLLLSVQRLNPCFSGGWSQSTHPRFVCLVLLSVLILVLVEDGLRAYKIEQINKNQMMS